MEDTYLTIADSAQSEFKEKMSKFIAVAVPIKSVEQAMEYIEIYQKKYFDARHLCWAYMLGDQRNIFRSNDNGEPSGTAGKPILGQINSRKLTNVLVMVIRYFGGIKLGTGGLITAYKQAASMALDEAEIISCLIEEQLSFVFEYPFLNDVMRIVKEMNATIIKQQFEMDCEMTLSIRQSLFNQMRDRLEKVESLRTLAQPQP